MKIYTEAPEGATVVQNSFIDQYMPHANGEFVKVYLYLLRCANTGRDLSLSSIADVFEHTEKDIQRAVSYWEKQQLLRIKAAADGTLTAVTFLDPSAPQKKAEDRVSSYKTAPQTGAASSCGTALHSGTDSACGAARTTEARPNSAQEQQDLRQLFFIAEQYLQRTLTSSEQTDFVYYYDELHFSADLIEYLLEYCISKGSSSRHYMRKVALAWAEAGITTVMQAKQETNLYNKNYFTIMNTFGIKGRNPAAPEQEIMSRWLNEFKFPLEIVLESCRRTICQTHQPNFQYADKILSQWYKSGVKSLADVETLDRKRLQEQKKAAQAQKPQKAASNRFNNFTQREYDYNQLEKQLLNR